MCWIISIVLNLLLYGGEIFFFCTKGRNVDCGYLRTSDAVRTAGGFRNASV